ncbi:hypothetical protein [Micromonospora sp. NPDC005324]|uniref:hypothetical protein n=1 Tax=Micromonospora sp. NPDC005324 TaxID=3157033 RepID=UPI0033B4672D
MVAGCRSYTAIGEWVADLPADTAQMLGINPRRRPSEAMLRRLLQGLDADRLTAVIAARLATRTPATGARRAIAVDGKSIHSPALLAARDCGSKGVSGLTCQALCLVRRVP